MLRADLRCKHIENIWDIFFILWQKKEIELSHSWNIIDLCDCRLLKFDFIKCHTEVNILKRDNQGICLPMIEKQIEKWYVKDGDPCHFIERFHIKMKPLQKKFN